MFKEKVRSHWQLSKTSYTLNYYPNSKCLLTLYHYWSTFCMYELLKHRLTQDILLMEWQKVLCPCPRSWQGLVWGWSLGFVGVKALVPSFLAFPPEKTGVTNLKATLCLSLWCTWDALGSPCTSLLVSLILTLSHRIIYFDDSATFSPANSI